MSRSTTRHPILRGGATLVIAAALVALSGCAAPAGAGGEVRTLRIASFAGDGTADTAAAKEWAALVTEYSGGELEFEFHLSGSLLDATQILSGVGDGVVDLGITSHGYYPGELPLSHVLNLGFQSSNSQALAATMRDLYANDSAYQAEWQQNNVRPLIFGLQSSTVVGCKEEVSSPDWFGGKNVRAAALIVQDFSSVDANVVSLVAGETLDAFERGVIDCWSALPLELASDLGLAELTPYIHDYGRGSNGALELMIGTGVWDSLTPEQQEAMNRASDEIAERFTEILGERVTAACDEIEAAGGVVVRFDDDEVEAWEEQAVPVNEAKFLEIAGPQGEDFLATFQSTLAGYEDEYQDTEDLTASCAARF